MTTHEPVGSLAEEAAKLFAALQGWASDRTAGSATSGDRAEGADSARYADEHAAGQHLSVECRYCPLCSVARFARAARRG